MSNAAKNASPSVLTTTPPWRSIAARSEVVVARDEDGPRPGPDRPLEARRALDVREQERDGRTGREWRAHRAHDTGTTVEQAAALARLAGPPNVTEEGS